MKTLVTKKKMIQAIKAELPMWDWPQRLTIMAFLGCITDRTMGGDGSFRKEWREEESNGVD